jgi:two-component system chemotaxis sensor kinase CheA
MSAFEGMEEMLQDFLMEAGDMLSDVDNKLVILEKSPNDRELLNVIFRGFHTIKGGAGFLCATPLVELCHRTENLFDKLRNAELTLTPEIMDVILAATGIVRDMFGALAQARMPDSAEPSILQALDAVLSGEQLVIVKAEAKPAPVVAVQTPAVATNANAANENGPDWRVLYHALVGGAKAEEAAPSAAVAAPVAAPAIAKIEPPKAA